MSENLLLPGFEPTESSESTPSAEASPAKTYRWLERAQVLTESEAAYGESSPAWLANFDPASSSWRTSGLFAAADSPLFSETLPRSGMTRSGTLFLLPPLVRLIYASGAGSSPSRLMPTPRAEDSEQTGAHHGKPDTLTSYARQVLLPTPAAFDANAMGSPESILARREREKAKGRNGNGFGLNLSQALALGMIPTPLASDAEQSGGLKAFEAGVRGMSLTLWARLENPPLLPTPQAQDHRNCADYSDGSRGHSSQLRHLGSGRLNPRFVEWMMDYPPGWTDLLGLDEPS